MLIMITACLLYGIGFGMFTFTLGVACSLFFSGFLNALFSWKGAFLITGIMPLVGSVIAITSLGHIPQIEHSMVKKVSLVDIINNRPAMLMIGIYGIDVNAQYEVEICDGAGVTTTATLPGTELTENLELRIREPGSSLLVRYRQQER